MTQDAFEDEVNKELAERVTRLRSMLDEGLEALALPVHFSSPAVEARGPERALAPLLRFLESARSAGSQKEILRALLDAATCCFPRVVLFILRSGTLVAWDSRDTTETRSAGVEGIGHLTIPASGDHLPARALASGRITSADRAGPGFPLTEALGGFVPAQSAAVPLVVRGRSVAILYGDCGSGSELNSESMFAMLGAVGSLSIEALGTAGRGRPAGPSRAAADKSAGPRGVEGENVVVSLSASHPGSENRRQAFHALEIDDPSSPTTAVSSFSPPAPEEAEMQALLGDIEGLRHEPADGELTPDDQRTHSDARRFASLLISEILLYNEEAVILGRRNHDLSKRLAREIEKSRQAFSARVPGRMGRAGRYFDEELVRVLAEGDPAVLGN